jgi:hypothetical protein
MMAGMDDPATRTGEPGGNADWAALGILAGKGAEDADCGALPEMALPRTTVMTGVPYGNGEVPLLVPLAGIALLGGT